MAVDVSKTSLLIIGLREELALIENRILEKEMAAKRRAERLAKNIAVRFKRTKIIICSFLIH